MREPEKIRQDDSGDYVCQHGTAMDVHCCNCHSGFLFETDHHCCEEPNCPNPGIECRLPPFEEAVEEYLCSEHAVKAGYCGGCGTFIAGSYDQFDCGLSTLCENCRSEEG